MDSHCGSRGSLSPKSQTQERETLWEKARLFKPVPTSQHGLPQSHVPSSLKSAEYVFVRQDCHRGTFQPPYIGPFRVLETGDKACKIDMGGHLEYVSVDRLKPAHLDLDQPVRVALPPQRGRPRALVPAHSKTQGEASTEGLPPAPETQSRAGRLIRAPRH